MILTPWHFVRWMRVKLENRAYARTSESDLLTKLNEAWAAAISDVPYWRKLVEQGDCPSRFESWEAYQELVPIMVKQAVAASPKVYFSENLGSKIGWSKTGGTIAEPLKFPVSQPELARIIKNEWRIRYWAGISTFSRQFKIWGHSHIFAGPNAKKIYRVRCLKDALLGMVRLSAYDLSEDKLAHITGGLRDTRCDFVMSYSRCLETVADALKTKGIKSSPTIKAVIATSECFSSDAAELAVAKAFNAPVYMEYGSAETGPIALRGPDGLYHVAWREFWLEAVPTEGGAFRLLITTLGKRAFPLFRYEIGDLVVRPSSNQGFKSFGELKGRQNEMLNLPGGKSIHSQAITHAIDGVPGVGQFQFVISQEGTVGIRIQTNYSKEEFGALVERVRYNLSQLDQTLSQSEIILNEGLLVTQAGKRPLVYRS